MGGRTETRFSWNNPEEEGNIVEPVVNNDEEKQVVVDVEVVENVLINNDQDLSEKDKELEQYFQLNLENLNRSIYSIWNQERNFWK